MQRERGEPVVIIGAGLIGLAIASELARRGAAVRVIDAHEPGRAASWAGAGMLAPYTEALPSAEFAAFCAASLALYPAFTRGLAERTGVDARLALDGVVEIAGNPGDDERLRARAATLAARGIAAQWLDREALARLEPALGRAARGACFSPTEGHVDNRRLGRALRADCAGLGVRVDENAGPVAIEADARRVLGVRHPRGFLPAGAVINAAGAWSGSLEGVPPRAVVPVVPVKGQMLSLAMPRNLVRHVVWVPGAYLVPRSDGRLLVGATVEDAGYDVRVTARAMATLLDAALGALPALGDLTVAETWAGLRPGSPDGLPFIGATALENYYVATGHYRNGILLTPGTAVLVADILEGRSGGVAAFSPQRVHEAPQGAAK
jgi:glycine oxidase